MLLRVAGPAVVRGRSLIGERCITPEYVNAAFRITTAAITRLPPAIARQLIAWQAEVFQLDRDHTFDIATDIHAIRACNPQVNPIQGPADAIRPA